MGSLRELVKAAKKEQETWLTGAIDSHLLQLAKQESGERIDGKFHPSQLSTAFCPRAWVIFNSKPDGAHLNSLRVNPRSFRIFANGHSLHSRIQRWVGDLGVLYGNWANNPLGKWGWGFKPQDGSPTWSYEEVKLEHAGDNIKGSTDGI